MEAIPARKSIPRRYQSDSSETKIIRPITSFLLIFMLALTTACTAIDMTKDSVDEFKRGNLIQGTLGLILAPMTVILDVDNPMRMINLHDIHTRKEKMIQEIEGSKQSDADEFTLNCQIKQIQSSKENDNDWMVFEQNYSSDITIRPNTGYVLESGVRDPFDRYFRSSNGHIYRKNDSGEIDLGGDLRSNTIPFAQVSQSFSGLSGNIKLTINASLTSIDGYDEITVNSFGTITHTVVQLHGICNKN